MPKILDFFELGAWSRSLTTFFATSRLFGDYHGVCFWLRLNCRPTLVSDEDAINCEVLTEIWCGCSLHLIFPLATPLNFTWCIPNRVYKRTKRKSMAGRDTDMSQNYLLRLHVHVQISAALYRSNCTLWYPQAAAPVRFVLGVARYIESITFDSCDGNSAPAGSYDQRVVPHRRLYK